jgi:hypothetical protein
MRRPALIQLGSNGDIVSLLPILRDIAGKGDRPTVICRPEYAAVLEAVSYADALPVDFRVAHPMLAEKWAKDQGFDPVLVPQVYQNLHRAHPPCENWQAEQWSRAGYIDRFHELPTVFDRRDHAGEQKGITAHLDASDSRPVLAYNLYGETSPYAFWNEERTWLEQSFPQYQLLDIGLAWLDKIHHLLGLLELADVLITIDTSTLHFAHATGTPTIALLPEEVWSRSEARSHWVYSCTYPQSVQAAHRERIGQIIESWDFAPGRLCRLVSAMKRRFVWHPVDYWLGGGQRERILAAQRTWDWLRWKDPHFRTVYLERQGEPAPTVRQTIDFAIPGAYDDEMILWAADRPVTPEIVALAREDSAPRQIQPGVFAFTVAWWRANGRLPIEQFAFAC